MKKWFSFNERTQRVEQIEPSMEAFSDSRLLYWTRGMDSWVKGPEALDFFQNPPAPPPLPEPTPIVQEPVIEPVKAASPQPSIVYIKEPVKIPAILVEPKAPKKAKKKKASKKVKKQKKHSKKKHKKTKKKIKKSKLNK